MPESASLKNLPSVTEAQVAEYLRDNPDFFRHQEDLLLDLKLPHSSGGAISLLERQVEVLREKYRDANGQLNGLVQNANLNDRLFEDTRNLILAMLDSKDINQLGLTLTSSCAKQFSLDAAALILLTPAPKTGATVGIRYIEKADAEPVLAAFIHTPSPVCGAIRPEEAQMLFGDDSHIQSAAVLRFSLSDGSEGLLGFGSKDGNRFAAAMATDFLVFIRDIARILLDRLH